MGQDIQLRTDPDGWVQMLGPVGDLAGKLARTDFVPKALAGNAAAVAAAILTGREMQLGPMASLRGIHIVEGRPSLTAEMLAARILAAGHRIEWKHSTDKACTVRIERADGLSEAEVTWTMADAQRAGLAGKRVWQAYARRMLQHRALTEAASMACPDVALGLDVGADVDDAPRQPATVTTIQPPVTVVQVAPEPEPDPEPTPEPDAAERPVEPVEEAPAEVVATQLVTPAQMRKIGALLGEMERLDGRKLDRDERRGLIAAMAGHPDPDSLQSAKELTKAQASAAIERLTEAVSEAIDAAPDPQDN